MLLRGASTMLRSQSGLTHIEVVIVVVMLVILAGITVSAANLLNSALVAGRAKGASDQLASAIRYTRQRAISEARDYCIATRTAGGAGEYQVYTGGRTGTTCTGSSVEGPFTLTGDATVTDVALRFTPISTVDPVGPTDVGVTSSRLGVSCTVIVTVTPEGGIQIPGTSC
jgi:Tfp pilus assembly protein FimT